MWGEFVRGLIVGLCLFYVPGYLFFRGLRLSPILALCTAPVFGVGLYACLPIAYSACGIPCSPLTVVTPALLLALTTYALSRYRVAKTHKTCLSLDPMRPVCLCGCNLTYDLIVPLLYVALSALVCLFVFLLAIPGANAFAPRFDNQTHLNVARAFLDSQDWSSLHASAFGASSSNQCPFVTTGSFYPCAWTCIVVLVCMGAGIDLMIAINVVVTLVSCVTFPLGMYVLMRALFPKGRRTVALGGIAITAFATWPWLFFYSGPLFPNQLGIALQHGILATIVTYVRGGSVCKRIAGLVSFSLVSFLALALTHPTTIFSCYVFLASFGAHVLLHAFEGGRRRAILVSYAVAITAFWLLCFHVPALSAVIGYSELAQSDLIGTLCDLAQMTFFFAGPQLVLVALSLAGLVAMLRRRKNRWLLLPLCFFALGYVFASVDWWPGKHLIAAFWYSDWRRMAANLIFYLMPLVAMGLDELLPKSCNARDASAVDRMRVVLVTCLVAIVYAPNVVLPTGERVVETPFGKAHDFIVERYYEPIYAPEEVDFVNRALEAIPKDALVINSPGDGSMWAYGVNGINTFYRSIQSTAQTDEAKLIRTSLCEYATNEEVQEAVKATNAQYVLLLDKDVPYDQGSWIWQYGEEQMPDWAGIGNIDDQTPGFSVVLSQGDDMRLYKIEQDGTS